MYLSGYDSKLFIEDLRKPDPDGVTLFNDTYYLFFVAVIF